MRTGRVAATVIVVIAVGTAGWLLRDHDVAHSAAPPPDPAIPVTAGTAQAQDVPVFIQEKGTLSFIDNHVDTTTGTIALRATFQNTDERLWPGEFVNARLILSVRHNAVVVPEATVMAGPDGSYVYVVGPEDVVQRRDVQLASQQDGLAVIAKGLAAGEEVVVDGQYRLANNVKVTIETNRPPIATTATTASPG